MLYMYMPPLPVSTTDLMYLQLENRNLYFNRIKITTHYFIALLGAEMFYSADAVFNMRAFDIFRSIVFQIWGS